MLYWKTLLKVILHNPRAIEPTINLAAMFIHFYRQSKFIVHLTNEEIKSVNKSAVIKFTELMLQEEISYDSHNNFSG